MMFIHREDKDKRYQDNTEVDNGFTGDFTKDFVDVEIIIAKHRNGPVGTVKLHFKEDQTRFESVSGDSQGSYSDAPETMVDDD